MTAAKKGKKSGKQKKGAKGTKTSGNTGFFKKFISALLVLSIIAAAVFFTLNNFNIKITRIENKNDDIKTELDIKKEEKKEVAKPEEKVETETATTKKEEPKKEPAYTKKESKELKTLSGCWLSSEQGAFITIDEYGYRIDFSNVDAGKPMTGNYFIENNLITFSSDGNECEDDGIYRITFYKKNMSLSCKNDDCTERRNVLEADWEWVEY